MVEYDALDFPPCWRMPRTGGHPLSVHFTDWLPRPGASSLAFADFLLDEAKAQPDPSTLLQAC
ncbi:MAG TPA: hypothetical protein VGD21_10660 [Lysobacter sp.]